MAFDFTIDFKAQARPKLIAPPRFKSKVITTGRPVDRITAPAVITTKHPLAKAAAGNKPTADLRTEVVTKGMVTRVGKKTDKIRRAFSKLGAEEKASSIVGEDIQKLLDQIGTGETEGVASSIQKVLLQMLLDIAPLAENAVRVSKGSKGVYQVNTLVASIREILADSIALQDRGLVARKIIDNHLRPSLSEIATQLVISDNIIMGHMAQVLSKEDTRQLNTIMSSMRRELALYLRAQYEKLGESITSALS